MKLPAFISRISWLAYLIQLTHETIQEWIRDDASRLAAALAYYTVFSMAPLLIIVIGIAGFFLGEVQARAEILHQVQDLLGPSGSEYISSLMETSWDPAAGLIATAVGFIMLLVGATGAFAQLQEALNIIWDAPARRGKGVWSYLRQRLLSFSLVLTLGFIMLVSLILGAVLSATSKYFSWMVPSYFPLFNLLNSLISFAVTTALFAAIYKILPDTKVRWRNVWLGAAFGAFMFTIGRYFIGLYLGQGSFGSVYGAAGSFVVILIWVYYSAQILFFGAEFTWVCAQHDGTGILAVDAKLGVLEKSPKLADTVKKSADHKTASKKSDVNSADPSKAVDALQVEEGRGE